MFQRYSIGRNPDRNPDLETIQQLVYDLVWRIRVAGYEPYLDFYYDEAEQLQLTVRPRRPEDPKFARMPER